MGEIDETFDIENLNLMCEKCKILFKKYDEFRECMI